MAQYFYGEIVPAAFNFAPSAFFPCDGRLLLIRDYTALFALIGTQFGGDGRDYFGLPNLNGRAPLGMGQGSGLTPHVLGDAAGEERVTLNAPNMPSHTHTLRVSTVSGNNKSADPAGWMMTQSSGGQHDFAPISAAPDLHLAAPQMLDPAGGGASHENMQPFQAIGYYICYNGVFPSRP